MRTRNITGGIAALCICGCMQDVQEGQIPVDASAIIAVNEQTVPETRTCIEADITNSTSWVAVLWTPSDELGVFTESEQNIKYTKYNTTDNEEVAAFVASETVSGTPTYAYYPYREDAGTDVTALNGNIPEIQTMDPAAGTLPGDHKVGVYKESTDEGALFRFTHIFSPVRIIIDGSGTDVSSDRLEGIDLTVTRSGAAVPVCGNFTFNGQTGAYTLTNTTNAVTFDWTTKPSLGASAQAYGTVFPEIRTGDELKFVIRTTSHTATVTVTAKVDFQANTIYTFPLTLGSLTGSTVIESNADGGSGDSGDSGSQGGTMTEMGTFTAATYNVDGLPQKISIFTINGDGPGSEGTTTISSTIAADNWDFIGFSEDFAYHTELTSELGAYNFGTYRGSVSSISSNDTDGLGFAAKNTTCSFSNENIVEFTSDYGGIEAGANTCIKKGFRHYVVTLADGTQLDVIITHMNTYSASGTGHINAQHAQLKQIAQYINGIRGNKRPVILMGDTNCRYTRHDFQTYFWGVLDSDLQVNDPWVEYQWDGVYPEYPSNSLMVSDQYDSSNTANDINTGSTQKGEVVDKIIYINNPDAPVQISANGYLRDSAYQGLADHWPIVVEFTYYKTN